MMHYSFCFECNAVRLFVFSFFIPHLGIIVFHFSDSDRSEEYTGCGEYGWKTEK